MIQTRFSRSDWVFKRLAAAVVIAVLCAQTLHAQGLRLLRDPDIEYGLTQLASPILRAAGLSPSQVKIYVVNDNSLNAFVIDNQHMFINSGLLQRLTSAEQVQAVIAHEAGHIASGHLSRRVANARNARTAAGLGLALAAVAAAAGSPEAGTAIAFGSQQSAKRVFFGHTRAEESSADISSVRYMIRAGIDPQGALDVQKLFRGQEALSVGRRDPYTRTHPLSSDRARALRGLVAGQKFKGTKDPTAAYWFARVKAKLSAFTRAPSWTLRRAGEFGYADVKLMRQAIAYHRQSDAKKALNHINKAIAQRPKDPFLLELKGQIQLESRQFNAAVSSYQAAAKLAPRNAQILGGLGRAQLAAKQPKQALRSLEAARGRDVADARVLRDLAVTYAQLKQPAMASVVTAERYILSGRTKDAALHAKRAVDRLPRGSGPWQRANDVLITAQRAGGKRR